MFQLLSVAVIVLGLGQMLYPLNLEEAQTAMHQIYFAVLFGSGSITLGLGLILAFLSWKPQAQKPEEVRVGSVVQVYEGYQIRRAEIGFEVMGKQFDTLAEAKASIDRRNARKP